MNKKQIVIEIDENGNCSIEGKGFIGTECEKSMREIEAQLGSRVSASHKPEYRQRSKVQQRERA